MATTALFVEILVIGALAEVWIGLVIVWAGTTANLKDVAAAATGLGQLSTLLALPLLAMTYALGWIINFVSERLFKPGFQKRVRDRLFRDQATKYGEARILVLQKGSPELVREVLFDRHIIRIARGNVVNFALLAVALLLNLSRGSHKIIWLCSAISMVLAFLSFWQWLTRYRSQYERINTMVIVLSGN